MFFKILKKYADFFIIFWPIYLLFESFIDLWTLIGYNKSLVEHRFFYKIKNNQNELDRTKKILKIFWPELVGQQKKLNHMFEHSFVRKGMQKR